MPSLTPDPDRAFMARLADMERRIKALETRRSANRAWISAEGGDGDTFTSDTPTEVTWDSVVSNDNLDVWDNSTGITLPYDGTYLFVVTMPHCNVDDLDFNVKLLLTPDGGGTSDFRETTLNVFVSLERQTWVPIMGVMSAGDTIEVELEAVSQTRVLTENVDLAIVQVA